MMSSLALCAQIGERGRTLKSNRDPSREVFATTRSVPTGNIILAKLAGGG